jgi:arginyl-tRNA synthetase
VLQAVGTVRDERLTLCALTQRTLAVGLSMLGIQAPTQM